MNHDEFISINNVLKKYNEIKKKTKKPPEILTKNKHV